jgi:hypothetical protein
MARLPPDFDNAIIDGELLTDIFPDLSRNHIENIETLARYVAQGGQRPIIVSGISGSGKTTLVNQFVGHRLSPRIKVEWIHGHNLNESVEKLLLDVRSSTSPAEYLVVIDNTQEVEEERLQRVVNQLFNWKKIRNIIVTTSADIHLNRAHRVNVFWPEGKLYGLREQLIVPRREIISQVAPAVLTVNSALIEKLERSPDDLYKITPRQFEEVIADLLTGMGMDVELTPATRDGGKDILAYMNTELGRFLTLVEAKQHNKARPVGVGLVRSLYGTLVDHQANSAMLVTTSRFAKPAKQFQERHRYQLSLKGYQDVVSWILKHKS